MSLVLPEEEHEVKETVVKEKVKEETKAVEVEKASCCEARLWMPAPKHHQGGGEAEEEAV